MAGARERLDLQAHQALGSGGYDAGKKTKGLKRHVAMDTDGHLLMLNVTTADVQDAEGAELIIKAILKRWPWLISRIANPTYCPRRLSSIWLVETRMTRHNLICPTSPPSLQWKRSKPIFHADELQMN
ncbi:transposase [Skermanella stibiiresistens]|uniref:transposase n=1 Tax=Skermanella stibiiresistens TaxID=913326 RepID=UPI0012FAC2B7|nr:transposase [Skermanella stibiiresistens]